MTNYYFYMGYKDGSGKPHGYVVKCYTEEQYLYYTNRCGLVLVLIGEKGDGKEWQQLKESLLL